MIEKPGHSLFDAKPDARQTKAERPEGLFRKRYRALSPAEIEHHDQIKDSAQVLHASIEAAFNFLTREPDAKGVSAAVSAERARARALAKTKLEEAIMWAIKGLTA